MAMEDPSLVQVNGAADQSIGEVTPQLEGEQLRSALLKQLEYYFSRENLEKDDFLKSQMNAEFFVPIQVIAAFKMVRNLTTDVNLIVEVLKSSKEVVVSEAGDMVRPHLKTQRNTLILRDISSETPQTEIEQIFSNERCAPVKSIKPEIGNTWFVSFETEQEAINTLMVLRTLTFKGQAIQARVKSENPLKNLLAPTDSYVPNAAPFFPQWNNYPFHEPFADPSFQGGIGKHPRNPNSSNGRGGPRTRNPRSDQPNQSSQPNQSQPNQSQQHREPGVRGNREGREPRQENRPEGKSADSKPEHSRSSEGRGERGSSRSQENRGSSGESSREAGSARKGNDRSLPAPSKDGQEGYKPKTGGQGKRGERPGQPGKTSVHPKPESQPRSKPRNVPLGPESFPPLPGAPAAKNQENSLVTLNYSAVAHAGADKPVQNERSNRRNRSHENSEKKSSPAPAKTETAPAEEAEAAVPSEKEKEPESPETKEETEASKGQPSNRSYAEILRAKAALKEQNAAAAAAAAPAAATPAEEAAGEAPPASSAPSTSHQRNQEGRKGGEGSSGRGNRSQDRRRNPSSTHHKESGNHVQVDSEGFQKPTRTSRPRQDRSDRYKERQPRSRAGDESTPAASSAPVEAAAPAQAE